MQKIIITGEILKLFCCSSAGDVHVGMVDRGGQLEVEVNQARGLIPKPGSRNVPGTLKSSPSDGNKCSRSNLMCVSFLQRPM